MASTNWRVLSVIALAIGVVGLISCIYLYIAGRGYIPTGYGVVIDAGSAHTRLTLYKWEGDKKNDTALVLEATFCENDFVAIGDLNATQVDQYLQPCLTKMSTAVDEFGDWDEVKVPVYFGATAGLRLLNISDPTRARELLDAVAETIKASSWLVMGTPTADVLTGGEEGLFAWITTNYLLEQLSSRRPQQDSKPPHNTVAMLDLGGGSAQIAYEVKEDDGDEKVVKLFGVNHTVHTSSNLCFGVDDARYRSYFLLTNERPTQTEFVDPCMPTGSKQLVAASDLYEGPRSVCLRGPRTAELHPAGNYTFTGSSDPKACRQLVSTLLDVNECEKMFDFCPTIEAKSMLENSTVLAISMFADTVAILNLTETKMIHRVDFVREMDAFCELDLGHALNVSRLDARYVNLYCFQLKLIESTLVDVYKLTNDWSNVRFASQVFGESLGWSLGMMIEASNSIAAKTMTTPIINTIPFALLSTVLTVIVLFGVLFVHLAVRDGRSAKLRSNFDDSYEPIHPQM